MEAKKVNDPKDYPFSSHHHYLSRRKAPRWPSLGEILSNYRSRRDFHEFVLSENEESLSKFYTAKRHAAILGGEDFINRLKEGGFSLSGEHMGYETGILRPPVSSVIRQVAELYKVSQGEPFSWTEGQDV